MNIPKQVIVVRKDIKMPTGKILAQVAHASLAVVLNQMRAHTDDSAALELKFNLADQHARAMHEWITGSFTKVVVGIDTADELEQLITEAAKQGIPHSRIVDSGRTVFNGVPTLTCAGFGPVYSDVLDGLTGHLKLLNKI